MKVNIAVARTKDKLSWPCFGLKEERKPSTTTSFLSTAIPFFACNQIFLNREPIAGTMTMVTENSSGDHESMME